MAECAYCKTETFLYYGGVPVCVKCAEAHEAKRKPPSSDRHVRTTLFQEFVEATARVNAASEAFIAVMGDVPSGLPHSDGTQRIDNASRELSEARKEVMRAHTRLNDFLGQGIIPEELKQGSGG
jgi:hypothetical protein